jgi:hypothetical protein
MAPLAGTDRLYAALANTVCAHGLDDRWRRRSHDGDRGVGGDGSSDLDCWPVACLATGEGGHRGEDWHGYIPVNGIDGWDVRLAEDPDSPTPRVVIEVLASNAENQAHNLRQVILRDGKISRAPTAEEWDFLKHLHKKYGYGEGTPVGYPGS